jgi:ABC-2 type transport system permease protein
MSQGSEPAAGNIYDLGYRRYAGARLGRRHAVLALYVHSLRGAFGLGRRASAKVVPIALFVLVMLPALLQLGIAAVANNIIEVIKAENYYAYVQVILALFCAAVAPEIVGRDQRNRTLTLYFSRALEREDYVAAKYAALATAMLSMTLLPQAVLFIGNGLAGKDLAGYLQDEKGQVVPIIVSAIVVSLMYAGLGLWIASQTSRRAYATGGVLAAFVLTGAIVTTLVEIGSGPVSRFPVLLSPWHVTRGLALWVFGSDPAPESNLGRADLDGIAYFLMAWVFVFAAAALLVRRYRKLG